MLITEEGARQYVREKYGKELPADFHGIDYQWSEKDLEWMEKYVNGELDNGGGN